MKIENIAPQAAGCIFLGEARQGGAWSWSVLDETGAVRQAGLAPSKMAAANTARMFLSLEAALRRTSIIRAI